MKKNYESPKVEKLEFNYVDVVTASTSTGPVTPEAGRQVKEKYYTSPQAGSPPPCCFQERWVSACT